MEEKKKEEWTMPEDIVVIETSKPEEMLNKYLAESAVKSWTEDFTNEVTGEKVSVERNEVLFDRGTFIDNDLLSKIMFSIQAEEIKTVKVTDVKPMKKRIDAQVRRYIVKLSDGLHSINVYTTRCKTPEDAAQMVGDYYTIYPLPNVGGDFSVLESEATSLRLLYKEELDKDHWGLVYNISYQQVESHIQNVDKVPPAPYQKERFFKVSVCNYVESLDTYEKYSYVYVVPALIASDAIRLVLEYVGKDAEPEDGRITDITSVGKAKVDFAIPQSYAVAWCDKKYGVGNY